MLRRSFVLLVCCLSGLLPLAAAEPAPGNPLVHVDLHGDPLPADAVACLGTVRLRHASLITAIALSPDGRLVAAGDDGATVRVWDAQTGKEKYRFLDRHLQFPTRTLLFSPDSKFLNVVSYVGHVRRWSMATGKVVAFWGGQNDLQGVQFSPDGKTIARITRGTGEIRLRDVMTGKKIRSWEIDEELCRHLVFSPDGKTLAAGYNDGRLRLLDVDTGAERVTLRRDYPKDRLSPSVTFTADSRRILTPGSKNTIRVYDAATGRLLHSWPAPEAVSTLICSTDGKTLVTGSYTALPRVWDLPTGKPIRTWKVRGLLVFSSDGKRAASIEMGQSIKTWDMTKLEALHADFGPTSSVNALAFAPDGKTVAAAGQWDHNVWLWKVTTGNRIRQISESGPGIDTLAFAPDGKSLIGADMYALHIWAITGQKLYRQPRKAKGLSGLVLSPDGKTLAEAYEKGTRLWDTATRKVRGRLPTGPWSRSYAFSADGKTLATRSPKIKSGDPETVCLWDVASGKELRRLPVKEPTTLALSPDGLMMAVSGKEGLELWSVDTGKRQKRLRRFPVEDDVKALAFSPDGRVLASTISPPFYNGHQDRLFLWELASGLIRHEFTPPLGGIHALAFSPDGRLLASGNADTTVLLWDVVHPGSAAARRLMEKASAAELWKTLDGTDARRAFQAIQVLAARPRQTLAFLRKHLLPAQAIDARRIERLLADLDGNSFTVRNDAATELERCVDRAEAALRKLLAGGPALEMRRRITRLLAGLADGSLPTGHLQRMRALEAVERMTNPQARRLLERLAGGAP